MAPIVGVVTACFAADAFSQGARAAAATAAPTTPAATAPPPVDAGEMVVSGPSPALPAPVPGVAPLLTSSSINLVSAAIDASPANTQFRVSLVPLYLIRKKYYYDVLSELKLGAYTDTSNSLTEISFGIGYNPFALQGHRAKGIWTTQQTRCDAAAVLVKPILQVALDCGDNTTAERCDKKATRNAPPPAPDQIDPKIDFDFDAKATSTQTAQVDLLHKRDAAAAAKALLERARANDLTLKILGAAGAGAADGLLQAQGDQQAIANELNKLAEPDHPIPADKVLAEASAYAAKSARDESTATTALNSAIDKLKQTSSSIQNKCNRLKIANIMHSINQSWIPQVRLNGAVDVFPSGKTVDPADKSGASVASLESWGGWHLELDVAWRPLETLELNGSGQYRRVRANGTPHTDLENYYSGNFQVAWLLPFISRADREMDDEYLTKGSLHGITFGTSVQALSCQGLAQCANGVIRSESLTPFIDIRALDTAQFRFSVPVKWSKSLALTGDVLGATYAPTVSVSSAFPGF